MAFRQIFKIVSVLALMLERFLNVVANLRQLQALAHRCIYRLRNVTAVSHRGAAAAAQRLSQIHAIVTCDSRAKVLWNN